MKDFFKKSKKNPWINLIWNEIRRIKGKNKFNSISDEKFIENFYYKAFGENINLENPQTFNEKINWLKLNCKCKNANQCADKYEVRDYIKSKGYEYLLNELIDVYEDINDINLEKLPEKFVLKATHGSGWNLIVNNKDDINWFVWKLIMKSWLKQNFYWYGREWVYKDIKPRIVCEKFLEDNNGELLDYKILCFNGEPKLIQVDIDRFKNHKRNIYDTEWNLTSIKIFYENYNKNIDKPKNFDEMLAISRDISRDFKHVRVDFYEVNGKLYFGELTFFHESGSGIFNSKDYDKLLGKWLEI